MRYTVNEHTLFVNIDFTMGDLRYGNLYLPWHDKLNKITIRKLLCKEHHKVPDCHDPNQELKHDGFIFVDETTDAPWYNQYPSASYGQIDDSNNWRVRNADITSDLPLRELVMTDLSTYMCDLLRGISQLKDAKEEVNAGLLQDHLDALTKIVEEEYKMRVVIERPDDIFREVTFTPM